MTWLVDQDAVEGRDYPLDRLLLVWGRTSEQDGSSASATSAPSGAAGTGPVRSQSVTRPTSLLSMTGTGRRWGRPRGHTLLAWPRTNPLFPSCSTRPPGLRGGLLTEDVTYHRAFAHGTVRVAINRPGVRNAFRPRTVDELYVALDHARQSPDVGCVLLTGNGPSPRDGGWAFSSGGDQRVRGVRATSTSEYEAEGEGAGAGGISPRTGSRPGSPGQGRQPRQRGRLRRSLGASPAGPAPYPRGPAPHPLHAESRDSGCPRMGGRGRA